LYEGRLDELASTNTNLREALCNLESGVVAHVDGVQRQLNAALQHQASLNIQNAALLGELRVTIAAAKSRAAIAAKRDASITLITTQLERPLKNETATSVALAQARAALAETICTFRGLGVQVRLVLEALGLEPPLIPSEPDGSIAL
jgi:hypothetical protein